MNITEKGNELWEMLHGDTDTIEITDKFLETKSQYFKNRTNIYSECLSILNFFEEKKEISTEVKWWGFRDFISFSDREIETLSEKQKGKYMAAVAKGFETAIAKDEKTLISIYTKESEYKKIRLKNLLSADPRTYRIMSDETFEMINKIRVQDFKTLISHILDGDGAETWCKKMIALQAQRVFEIKKIYSGFVINQDLESILLQYYEEMLKKGEIRVKEKENYVLVKGLMYRGFLKEYKNAKQFTIRKLCHMMETSFYFLYQQEIKELVPKEEFGDLERKMDDFFEFILNKKKGLSNGSKGLLKSSLEKVLNKR